jgi:hypothetical protein
MQWERSNKRVVSKCQPKKRKKENPLLRVRRSKVPLKDKPSRKNLRKPKFNKRLNKKNKENRNKPEAKTETFNNPCPHVR